MNDQPVLFYCTLDQVEEKWFNLVYVVQLLILLIKSGSWLRNFSFQNSVSLVTQLDISGWQPSRMLWIKQKTGLSVDSHVSGIGEVKAGFVIQWRTRVELVPCQGLFNLFNINKILNLSWVTNYVTQAKIFSSNITWSGSQFKPELEVTSASSQSPTDPFRVKVEVKGYV